MTTYYSHGVSLSEGQRSKLTKAYKNNSAITIRLAKNELNGSDELMLTKTQINKIKRAMKNGTGVDIKISKTQIRKAVKNGGSLWSSLLSLTLGTKLLPYATKAASKAVPALATGAMNALGSLGIDKIFGKGQRCGFLIPQNKVNQLIQYKDWLTESQKMQILDALQNGGQIINKPTKTQQGAFLGTLLASIGVPLLLNALTGKGLQVDRQRSERSLPVYVPPPQNNKDGGLLINPYSRPPPLFGTWENPIGMGVKKKLRKKGKQKRKQPAAYY